MRERATQVLRATEAQGGFTLPEVLVVLAIVGIVITGITQLLTSAMKSQTDQTNRTEAQQHARLGLDKLRREIRCASGVTPTPIGYPASSITISLGSYCPTAGGATTVTWCTKDKNGNTPPAATGGQPYTLWRYTGSACSGTGTRWASDLVDKIDVPSVSAGKIFGAAFVPAASLTSAPGGTLTSGSYSYAVTAVLASGEEVPGTVATKTIASGVPNQITIDWSASPYPGATSYNVYGWDDDGLRLLKKVSPGTSFVDTGPTTLTDNPLTLPSPTGEIHVSGTSNFNAGANTIAFGPSGPVTCTGITLTPPAKFTGCTGGQAGDYPPNLPVYAASSARPPRAALAVSLPLDKTPANPSQRFVLLDTIVLRNSQPF
jgi:prepilin-type N-terminal cleavage/methylation domain-containing protein